MKRTIIISLKPFIILAIIVILAAIPAVGVCGQNVTLFQSPEYSSLEYTGYTRAAEYVTMTDGTKLASVRYVPAGGPKIVAFPVILIYHAYHYEVINPETGETQPTFMQESMDFYTSYGYVVVNVDMRGSGGSYGSRMNLSPQLAEDGKEVVDWIAGQSWCDGNVGMIGVSYMGWSQFATAGRQPDALKCIIPGYISFDEYTRGSQYPGGIRHNGGMFGAGGPSSFDMNVYWPSANATLAMPATPVIDEDGDGELADEIPLDLNGDGSFIDDYQLTDILPQYLDGEERQHEYYFMTMEHLKNPFLIGKIMGFRDDPVYVDSDLTFDKFGPNNYPIRIAETGIPILQEAGWFDRYVTSQTQWYATLKKTNPSGLVISPTIHGWTGMLPHPNSGIGPYHEYFGEDVEIFIQGCQYMRLRFLDYYLKGIGSRRDKKALSMVYIYVMNGEGWRMEKEWPLKRQKITQFFFNEGYSLTDKKRKLSQGSDDYVADFTHDNREDSTGAGRWGGVPNSVLIRTQKDAKCLTYTMEPLEKDMEVTGHPIAHLWVSSTADYGDFYVYLEDVDENGNALYVTDGQLRAGFANLVPNEDMLPEDSNLDVLPDLPWHGYKASDYTDRILANDNIVELTFELFPTSWVFKKGHQVRVSIACADYPTFLLHPMLSPSNDPDDPDNIVPTITVYRDKVHRSHVELPVIKR